ncbi:a9c2453e-7cea-46bb-903b-02bfd9aa8072 [Thermothielavioides terrestris]|uniref:A9c2453e-7cea-46bb-903b-02bfd9aa8072 n=1 Tax=Thermothielavioides terrestris TaxID=2587410 RepID=A0A3S5CXQ0_9PEZI|nr:a9c2453e-7cea-46bb-903b-02bfd9aa8072 [Thermothielavioides terrestris]
MTTAALNIGHRLRGRLGTYTLTRQLYETVWLASNTQQEPVIIKAVRHVRLENERQILKRFPDATVPFRALIDEIQEPQDPPALVLKHYDSHVGEVADKKGLSAREIRHVARRVLEALRVLHENGFVHTDVKPDNIMVNLSSNEDGDGDMRFKDACLADFGNTVSVDSEYAVNGYPLGTPIFRSPETTLILPFGPPADVWSFGATLISLLYGEGFDIFRPDVPVDHELYVDKILTRFHQFFGPYPKTYLTLPGINDEVLELLIHIISTFPPEQRKPFQLASRTEISHRDRDFICKIMKLDPRDRPTVQELLDDDWFQEEVEEHEHGNEREAAGGSETT